MAINWARRACCGLTAAPSSWHPELSTPAPCWGCCPRDPALLRETWLEAQVQAGESRERGRRQGLQPKNPARTSPRRLLLSPGEILTQASAKSLSMLVTHQQLETNFTPKMRCLFIQTWLHVRIFASFPDFSAFPQDSLSLLGFDSRQDVSTVNGNPEPPV